VVNGDANRQGQSNNRDNRLEQSSWAAAAKEAWRSALGPDRVRQHANESPWELPAELKAEVLDVLAEMPFGRYDFALRPLLLEALAGYTGVPAAQIIPGNGADELIQLCMMALPAPEGRVVITNPTFFVYPYTAGALGRTVVDVPLLRPGFTLDLEGLRQAARPGDLVFVCRPNNPTGNVFAETGVRSLLDQWDGQGVRVVIDEAYYEFCGSTLVDEVTSGRRRGVVILRTLSKAFRLAGLRIGYALSCPELVPLLERARLTYNLSAASIAGALGVLSRPDLARETAALVAGVRPAFENALTTIPGVTVYPSETNFILVDLPCAAAPVQEQLAAKGILLRNFPGDEALSRNLRITVGEAAANDKVVSALAAAVGGCPQ